MGSCIYTKDEVITNIKAVDMQISEGVSQSKLDTKQTSQSFMVDVKQLKNQRDYWMRILQQYYPSSGHSDNIKARTDRRFRRDY